MCAIGQYPRLSPALCIADHNLQLLRGGGSQPPALLSSSPLGADAAEQGGRDSHSFLAAVLKLHAVVQARGVRSKTSFGLLQSLSSATVIGFHRRTWRPSSLHSVPVTPECRAVGVVSVCAVE